MRLLDDEIEEQNIICINLEFKILHVKIVLKRGRNGGGTFFL